MTGDLTRRSVPMASECSAASTCPHIADTGGGTYLVVGATTTAAEASEHGGNVAEHETAVEVPKGVIDDVVAGPLLERIARLEAQRDKAWLLVGELREAAKADGRDPYGDPVAQALSAILCEVPEGGGRE